jgi:hypothetical protein
LADGTITLAFRRWSSPHARAGALHRTPAGVLAIDAVAVVGPDEIGDHDARLAGYASREELLGSLRGSGDLYRIELHHAGDDPRITLRETEELSDEDVADLRTRLARLDQASPHGPWTLATLRLIAGRPAVVSTELASELGRERLPFKRDVRKLKELGLTESLEVGYRLSPRGRALMARLDG